MWETVSEAFESTMQKENLGCVKCLLYFFITSGTLLWYVRTEICYRRGTYRDCKGGPGPTTRKSKFMSVSYHGTSAPSLPRLVVPFCTTVVPETTHKWRFGPWRVLCYFKKPFMVQDRDKGVAGRNQREQWFTDKGSLIDLLSWPITIFLLTSPEYRPPILGTACTLPRNKYVSAACRSKSGFIPHFCNTAQTGKLIFFDISRLVW